jgi:hypothetical protein
MYMVSVDDDKSAWTQAISEDGLKCINVGDMKGSIHAVNKYNIRALPSNYLLDKEGNIIAKNLAGPAMGEVFKKVLK